ncbi:MAG: DUF3300 domain-containing protein [Roseiarcus sp.]|jgi:hypothetical protein
MKSGLVRAMASAFLAAILGASAALAQSPSPAPSPASEAAPQLTPAHLDSMLAPIALYPDALLAQVLMAATYPLEVVLADRWLQDPGDAALKGDQLAAALAQQTWDPSVKSLVPFPRILHMMDGRLDWTERLGEAFLADQGAVMDSIQRLRRKAQSAGNLRSAPQAAVATQEEAITIEPPSPTTAYVPVCDPAVVYGAWPYPADLPDYFPGYFGGATAGGFGCGWFAAPIVAPLWGWPRWDWRRHRIDVDRERFTALNGDRPPVGGGAWEHDLTHRHGVPYRDPQVRDRFSGGALSLDARRSLRGYPTGAAPAVHRAGSAAPAPGVNQIPTLQEVGPPTPRPPPTFESFGRGPYVRIEAERGRASRMSMPTFAPGGFAPHFAPRGFAPRFEPSGGGMRRR